jgi:hypothetical protein
LYRALQEFRENETFGGDYNYRMQAYFEEIIQARVKCLDIIG